MPLETFEILSEEIVTASSEKEVPDFNLRYAALILLKAASVSFPNSIKIC